MKYEIQADRLVVYPEGDVDIITAEEFKQECYRLMEEHPLFVVFDCKTVDFIDSTGLGAFVAIHKKAAEAGRGIALKNLKPTIKKLFVITKLDEVMSVEEGA